MKIVHLVFGLTHGGIETMLVGIVNEQVKTEDVSLIIINDMIADNLLAKIDKRTQIFRLNRRIGSHSPLFLIKLNYLLLRLQPHIIHYHFPETINYVLPFLCKKMVLTVHNTNYTFAIPFLPKFKKIYSISKSVQQELKSFGMNSEVVYNGIDTSSIKTKTVIPQNTVFRIIQISRLDIQLKGQHLLIEAIDQIVNKYNKKDIHLDFAGNGKDYELLKEMIKNRKIEKYVTCLGDVRHDFLQENLCDYDLLVQPSLYEGFGLTVIEAMIAGVPTLVSDIEGPMEIIDNGRFGCFFQTNNVENLIEKLLQIIDEKDIEKQKQQTEKARQHVLANFDVKNTAKTYINKYKELITKQ